MKLLKIRLITAICLAGCLCACGEGGAGGSVASTPAPLPAPTPTPTPSPTPSPLPAQTFSGTGGSALAITTASQTLTPSVLSAGPLPQNLGSNANALVIARDASGGYAITVRMLEGNGAFAGEAVTKQFSFPITSRTGTSADQTSSEFSSPATGGGT